MRFIKNYVCQYLKELRNNGRDEADAKVTLHNKYGKAAPMLRDQNYQEPFSMWEK
jgi:hypothetical protein